LRSLLGRRERAAEVAASFQADPHLGMVGAHEFLFKEANVRELAYQTNKPFIDEYCRRFGLKTDKTDFIAGTIFSVRAEPFLGFFARHDPLAIAAELPLGDHSDEDRPTRTHALERVFSYIITAQGYAIRGISVVP